MRCFANLHLIGMRKCGTSDFSKWFKNHPELQFRVSVSKGFCMLQTITRYYNIFTATDLQSFIELENNLVN